MCEAEAVSRLLYLAHLAGDAPVNVVHLSTKLGLRPSVRPRRAGRRISMSRPPSLSDARRHLLSGAGEDGFAGAKYVMSPPLRHAGDRAALREALVAGEIDTIATDHCSFNLHGQRTAGATTSARFPTAGRRGASSRRDCHEL
ncbi:MAG: hypothetical protein ACLTYW_10440 [Collinsella sp.]